MGQIVPIIRYTQRGLEALAAQPHAKRVDYFDSSHKGLCLTVGLRGGSWYLFRRIDGKQMRLKLGRWPLLGIAEARKAAGKVEEQIAAGKHPKAEQARERAAVRESITKDEARMVRRVAASWAEMHLPTLSKQTRADYRREMTVFVEAFGDEDIGLVRRGQLVQHLDRRKTAGNGRGLAANLAATVIRQIFRYAQDRLDLEHNPAFDLKNPVKQSLATSARTRTLDRNEIRVLWRACELADYPYGHLLRFALCTAQRIGEVGAFRRSDIDDSGEYWTQRANKTRKRIDLFIAPLAREVLEGCPHFGDDAPFFSASADEQGNPRPLRSDTLSQALALYVRPRVSEAANELGLPTIREHWTPHDLRRTVRTGLTGWCNVLPDTAERVLNHGLTGIRAVYDHSDYRPHVAEALRAWDDELQRIVKGEGAKVTRLRKRGAA